MSVSVFVSVRGGSRGRKGGRETEEHFVGMLNAEWSEASEGQEDGRENMFSVLP